jgi:3-oxoacid CoA-transferase subunit B
MMQHCNKHGEAKILDQCSLPLTGQGVVSRIISKLGVFDIINNTVRIIELAPNISLE